MTTGVRAPIGVEDLLLGEQDVIQKRNSQDTPVSGINASNIPYVGTTPGVDRLTIREALSEVSRVGVYNFSTQGGAVGDFVLFDIPDNAVITKTYYEVITALDSGGLSTVALSIVVDGVEGLLAEVAFDDASVLVGYHDGIQNSSAANFSAKTTAKRDVVLTIGGGIDLIGGLVYVWCSYIVSE